MASSKEWQKMLNGELYWAWDDDHQANRERCRAACQRFNEAGQVSRRRRVELWRNIVCDTRPVPPVHPDPKEDENLFAQTDPAVDPPISVDHGQNFKVGKGSFLNVNLLVLDTCLVIVGERVLFGPNVCLYSATHPLDPAVRRGLEGPEAGKEIHIEDDVWIGGSVIILGGVRIGRGCTIGAGAVVTKDIPPLHFAAGNPARIIRRIETSMDLG
ncbi:sugar O-acetyltransferase [Aspergillus ruber CBS 135680]|uniref:Acetyltransferase, CysE/LacA/LpxA/NodL family n=1 Tax=Aspergillus ruber (strain CBS 135680) TaxID=1388766 RepID=A0A017S0K0_ASPRC|nr:acetyltransferase, CysE/LacA/LpxA/NodL family [Aspergillus ruber CBS 135680]EYE90144.1 acetyltransferase, CysE/LacA/LpxA/NodL family [Aspergillus ruber CBS 135680]